MTYSVLSVACGFCSFILYYWNKKICFAHSCIPCLQAKC